VWPRRFSGPATRGLPSRPLRAILESATGQPVEIERSEEIEPESGSFWSFSLDAD
jgi:hypothetical protein